MRILLILAVGGLASGEAIAQSEAWTGGYVGISGNLGGLVPESTIMMDVERAGRLDADYSNTFYEVTDGAASTTRSVSSDSAPGLNLVGGVTFDAGSFVWGGEARLEFRSIRRDLASESRWDPTGFSGRQASFPIPSGVPSGINRRTGIVQERESVKTAMEIGHSAMVLGRLGIPLGDSILVSALGGLSIAKVKTDITQTSEQLGAYYYNIPIPSSPQLSVPINTSATDQVSSEADKVGPVVGALAEIRLNQMWMLRADLQYSHLGKTKTTNSVGTTVTFETETWSTSIGMAYRF